MRVLASVAGEKIRHDWPDLIVDRSLAKELLSSEPLVETFERLASYLDVLGIGIEFVLRPEILGGEQAKPYLRQRVPDLGGHIYIGSPARFKYLKGCKNVFCAAPLRGADELKVAGEEFAFNPRRLHQASAVLNGFWLGRLAGGDKVPERPLWLPGRMVSAGIAKLGPKKIPEGLPVTTLFLDRADAQESARAMMAGSSSFGAVVSDRGRRPRSVLLAVLDVRDEWPTALGPTLSDLVALADQGTSFTCLVLLVGASALDLPALLAVSDRLIRSLGLAGVRKRQLRSNSIVLTVAHTSHVRGLLEFGDGVLLLDPNWPESEMNQLAVLAGLRPILLDLVHPSLLETFRDSAIVLSSRRRNAKAQPDSPLSLIDVPRRGAVGSLFAPAAGGPLSPQARTRNEKIARSALDRSTKQFKRIFATDAKAKGPM